MQLRLSLAPAALLLVAPALGQGADDCANAVAISGPGPHAFDNSAATDSGAIPSCGPVVQDVWFAWTAATTGPHIVSTCNGATNDTKAAVYDAMCGGAELGCNDDACGLQTQVSFDAVAGGTYLIQMGSWSAASAGAGTFEVTLDAPLLNPQNGSFYRLVTATLSWADADLAARGSSWMGTPGHLATIADQAELDWILNNVQPGRPWIGLYQDTASPSYAEPAGGWTWVTGEPVNFLNWAPGEPNNTSASAGPEDYAELFGNGQMNDAELNHANTFQYLIEYSGGGLGTNYCSANANSTGVTGNIAASGSNQVGMNDFTLEASDLPTNAFGFFITSRTQALTPNPGGSAGNLCLGGTIGRFLQQIQNTGTAGEFSILTDLAAFPQPNNVVAVQPGDTWSFQAWHRDAVAGSATSNFTNGLEVTFQ